MYVTSRKLLFFPGISDYAFCKGVPFENSQGRGKRKMKQRYLKQMGSFLLASAMVLTMFPTFSATVHAEENKLPTKEQFATVEELKSFNTNDKDGEINSAKVYFWKQRSTMVDCRKSAGTWIDTARGKSISNKPRI